MKTKITVILIILIFVTVVYAADKKWSIIAENTTVADADEMLIIDIGTGDSQRMTVLNFFDTIDTSLELLTILTNETGTGALVFAISPTLVTPALGVIASGVGTTLTALNGENIQNDTIDDDSIDFADITFADFDFETAWKMWHSDAAGDVTEITLGANGTFLESNGAAANPAFRTLVDGDVPDNITIDLATLATTVTVSDDEATNDDQEIVFTTDNVNLESDGDFHYSPDTGTVTATIHTATTSVITPVLDAAGAEDMDYGSIDVTDHSFTTDDSTFIIDGGITVSTGDNITLGAVQWNSADEIDGTKIKDADYGDVDVSAGGAWTLDTDSVADNEIDYANVTGADLTLTDAGAITSTGTITATVGFDIVGAADIDYGSIDVLDHTFVTDGTGDAEIVLPNDSIGDAEISWAECTFADFDYETAWKMWHSNAAGDVTEITLGANGTFLESNGAAAAPAFRTLVDGDVPDNITVDLATLATTVTLGDDDATNDNQDIVFTTDAAGPVNLEADIGDFYYNPSTGTVTATEYVGGGAGITGLSVDWENIGDAGGDGTIAFASTEQTITSTLDAVNEIAFKIDHTDADVTNAMTLFQIQSVDDNDPSLTYFKIRDASGGAINTVFYIGQNGNVDTDGNITVSSTMDAGTITEGSVAVYSDNEMDEFAEIDAIVADKSLVNLEDGGTFTGNVIANGNLSVGNATTTAGVLTLLEDDDDGANFASFMVPALGANTVYTLPPDDGDNTEVLQTDGAGALTWVANAGGGTSFFAEDGDTTEVEIDDAKEWKFIEGASIDIDWTDTSTGSDADPFDLTIKLVVADDEGTDDDQEIVFTTDNATLESDGDFHYSPDTGTVTATEFVGGGAGITGVGIAWDDITDPDLAQTIDFVTYTQTIDIGVTDLGGPKSGLILDVTGLGAGGTDVIALEITTVTNDDSDYIPIAIYDDSGADNDLLFKVDTLGQITVGDGIVMEQGALIDQSADNRLTFTENGDWIRFGYGGTNLELIYSDGVLEISNSEEGIDGIVQIQGKDGGEKGILRVMSDGDDNYIELHHDDTDGHIVTDTGDIHIESAGGDVSLAANNLDTTGNVNFGGADLELPQAAPAVPDADGEVELDFTDGKMVIQHGAAHAELGGATDVVMGSLIDSWGGTIYAPDGVNDVMTVKAINSIEFPHGVVITAVYLGVSENSNYTLTIQNFDDFDTINGANPTIDTVTYTADTTGEIIDTTPTYTTIAAGQIIMISIPATNVDWINFCIYYYEPAA